MNLNQIQFFKVNFNPKKIFPEKMNQI
jgi:hypothetical protein